MTAAFTVPLLLTVSVAVFPLPAVAAAPDHCQWDGDPEAATEAAATALAQECDVQVEVAAEATDSTKVYALPDGEFELESWVEPQWVEQGDEWVEIDTDLVAGADGLIRPVASPAEVAFSAGGEGPFATMTGAGARFTLAWPAPLPAGRIAGDTVTYPEVEPGVDLVVRAERGGFSHLLVVKTPAAAENPVVRDTPYLVGGDAEVTEVAGALVLSGPEGTLAAAPPPAAWDSTPAGPTAAPAAGVAAAREAPAEIPGDGGPGDAAAIAAVDVRIEAGTLTVSVDPGLLADAVYPVYIDPTYDQKWATWAPVNSSRPSTQWTSGSAWPREEARVGSNYDSHSDLWRAHFRFNTSVLRGKRITGTSSVDAYLIHTAACAGESIGIWQTNSIADNTPTWNGMRDKWLHGGALQTKTGKANTGTCGQSNNWLKYDGSGIGRHVQRHADAEHSSITFGLRMGNESGGRWAKFDPARVVLKATYQHKPHSPVAIRSAPGGNCNKTSPGPWINNRTPALYGRASDGDGTVRVEFQLTGPTSPSIHTSAWTNSGAERGWTAPTLAEGNYRWRVRGTDGNGAGGTTGWTDYCHFRLDHTGPTTPVVERVSGTPVAGQPVSLRFTSSDARSGVKLFAYGIGVDARQHTVNSSGSTTVTFTPEAGRTVVYVWAQDHAGNYSARAAYNFFTGRITDAQPMAVWRFDGDSYDDSGQERHLTLGSGVGYGADRNGHAGTALHFDGTGCAETTPVVRSDAELTLSAWVRLDDTSAPRAVLQQVDGVRYAVSMHYAHPAGRWRLTVTDGQGSAVQYAILESKAAPTAGSWHHLAGTVDPVARVMRLYVDGVLDGEREIPFAPWDGQGRFLVGCAGTTTTFYDRMIGAIDHVGVWQGLLSEAEIRRAASELPAGLVGEWRMRGDGTDRTDFARHISVSEDAEWVADPFGRVESALRLDGSQCAEADVPLVRTDESFSVAAWVRVDNTADEMTVLTQPGIYRSGFKLMRWSDNRWLFTMASEDSQQVSWFNARSSLPARLGAWQHVVGVYDATAGQLRVYVDGGLQGSAATGTDGWHAAGPLHLGCTWSDGFAHAHLTGAVAGVTSWRGALSAAEVAKLHGGNPEIRLEALWPLNGPGGDEPTLLTDTSGNQRHLHISGPYTWVRDRGLGREGALGLELAGDSCAETTGPAIRTDESFTVTAWVLLERTTDHHTVVSQAGGVRGGFYLKYMPTRDRWQFELPSSADGSTVSWHTVISEHPPELGRWTHLAGVYDVARGVVQLYVDGELQGEVDGPATPFVATGATLIGCAGATDGRRWHPLGGVVDDVRIWTSTVDPDRIADLAAG